MKHLRGGLAPVVAAILVALAACAGPGPTPAPSAPVQAGASPASASATLAETYAALARARGGRVIRLDPAVSAIRIAVFRAGTAARLGHDHVLSAPRFEGYFHLPPQGPAEGSFDLEFHLADLQIDDAAVRAGLGKAFETVLSPEAIASTREHMLGEANLQADRFPVVRIHSLAIAGEAPFFAAHIQVEMHGQTRDQWVPLQVQGLPDRLQVTGSLVLRQTDFGVRPYSIGGGLLAVRDEVVVDFQLLGS